ncbi:MAG: O-methyltransferase [Candidatus Levybacteria bacterium]|nr:O-methyltransferase [Candidatus Levybacteria bacterium]
MIDKSNWSISKHTNQYIEDTFLPFDEALDFALNNSKKQNLPPISINAVEGKLLYMLTKLKDAKSILELGTLGAYSTIWLAKALPKDGKVVTIEHIEEYAACAQENIDHAGLTDTITIKTGDALKVLPQLNETFDLFFIDAHKEEYIEYVEHAIRLSHPGSVIICDNVLRNGGVMQEHFAKDYFEHLAKFNKYLAGNPRLESTILPITLPLKDRDYVDGMSISVVK